jgi:hypothetical protein
METKVKDSGKTVNNGIVKTDKKEQFVAGNPVNKDSSKPEAEKPKEETVIKADQAKPQAEQAKVEAPKAEQVNQANGQPKQEQPKAEPLPEPKPAKPVLNLEETLKLVADLNRKKIQRDKLIETVENLEAFEIELKEDADETDSNIYQGCVLTIEDDNRRKFTTKNPVIIWTVAQQVNGMCVNKLAEIEAGIILPA